MTAPRMLKLRKVSGPQLEALRVARQAAEAYGARNTTQWLLGAEEFARGEEIGDAGK